MGSHAHIINGIVFILYLFLKDDKTAWPQEFYPLIWIPFFVHVYLHNFFDGLQNTTRNIARIYLIKHEGVHYNQSVKETIQHFLIPDSMYYRTVFWHIVHVTSFGLLLFYQGWATALIAEIGLIFLGGFIPLNYQSHLIRIQKHLQSMFKKYPAHLIQIGIYPDRLMGIINQAIAEKKKSSKMVGRNN